MFSVLASTQLPAASSSVVMCSLRVIRLSAVLVCYYAPSMLRTRVFDESDDFHSMMGISVASALLLIVMTPLSYGLQVLLERLHVEYLHAFALILIIMTVVQLLGRLMPAWGWKPVDPAFALLMTTHCGVFGVALLAARTTNLSGAFWMGLASAVAFVVLSLSFHSLHRRMLQANVPVVFRDVPLALVTAGFMALALMGLIGLVRD
jgi:electron transport complex protein RnfA